MLEAGKMMGYNFDKDKILGGALPEKGIIRMKELT
jgi:hypothetical protein